MKKVALITTILTLTTCICASAQVKYSIPFPKKLKTTPDTVSVMIIGDVMMHSRQLQYDHRTFLSGLSGAMRSANICIANMEFTLAGEPYSGYPCFSAPDEYAVYVADECGADVLLTANNHILDKGRKGLERTLGVYRKIEDRYGASFTGSAGSQEEKDGNNPLMIRRNGISIAFINFTYGTNVGADGNWPKVNRMDKEDVASAIEQAKKKGADFIVALPHWGEEYQLRHNSKQEEWAKWLAAKGVDAIVGAHPHVVQDSTRIGRTPVFYSIGNAVSNMSAINTRLGISVTLRFIKDFSGTDKRMADPQVDYFWCTLPETLTSGYSSIYIKEWATRRSEWLNPSDFDNMMSTYIRVKKETGVED